MSQSRDIREAMAAYELGRSVAKAYKVGDTFYGTLGEAERQGLTGQDRRLFIKGYLDHLPRPLTLDGNNVILSLGVSLQGLVEETIERSKRSLEEQIRDFIKEGGEI